MVNNISNQYNSQYFKQPQQPQQPQVKNKTIDKCPYCKNKEFIKYGNYNKMH